MDNAVLDEPPSADWLADPRLALLPYRSHLEAALAYAAHSHTFEDVVEMVASGAAQAWPGPASIMITEVEDAPRGRRMHVFLAAGSLPEIRAMIPYIATWAKAQGCVSATLMGRPGWARALAHDGDWTTRAVVFMERAL